MKEILKCLDRGGNVKVLYLGKPKGILSPIKKKTSKSMSEHPFFGMLKDDETSVEEVMSELRGDRDGAL